MEDVKKEADGITVAENVAQNLRENSSKMTLEEIKQMMQQM